MFTNLKPRMYNYKNNAKPKNKHRPLSVHHTQTKRSTNFEDVQILGRNNNKQKRKDLEVTYIHKNIYITMNNRNEKGNVMPKQNLKFGVKTIVQTCSILNISC